MFERCGQMKLDNIDLSKVDYWTTERQEDKTIHKLYDKNGNFIIRIVIYDEEQGIIRLINDDEKHRQNKMRDYYDD